MFLVCLRFEQLPILSWNCGYLVGILQVLRLKFQKFRILEILNFHPCICVSAYNKHISSWASGLNFGQSFCVHPYFVYASREISVDSVHMSRLTCSFAVHQCDKYLNLVCWLILRHSQNDAHCTIRLSSTIRKPAWIHLRIIVRNPIFGVCDMILYDSK